MLVRLKSLPLWQEIVLMLVLKCALLTIIWAVWFSSADDGAIDGPKAATQILSSHSR
jgi:hypothetical protein